MLALHDLRTCAEVTPELIAATFDPAGEPHPAQRVLRLLERMARIAKPNSGAERILLVLARLAQADWMAGRLRVTLSDFGVATEVDVWVDDGRKPARWRSFSLAVPLLELSRWVRQSPSAIRPLVPFGEPRADRLQLRVKSTSNAALQAVAPPDSARKPDVHRKKTARFEVQPPKEAFRTAPQFLHEDEPPKDTARPPVQPAKPTPADTDPTDEGWE